MKAKFICFWTSILDGDFDQGGIWDFREVYTPWDPDGAVIRLDHLIAVGRGLRLRVGSSRSEKREIINRVPILTRVGKSINIQQLIEAWAVRSVGLSHCEWLVSVTIGGCFEQNTQLPRV